MAWNRLLRFYVRFLITTRQNISPRDDTVRSEITLKVPRIIRIFKSVRSMVSVYTVQILCTYICRLCVRTKCMYVCIYILWGVGVLFNVIIFLEPHYFAFACFFGFVHFAVVHWHTNCKSVRVMTVSGTSVPLCCLSVCLCHTVSPVPRPYSNLIAINKYRNIVSTPME